MIHEFVWILGMKSGKPIMNPDVEAIYINRLNVSSGYGYVSRINIQDQYYKAFFKLRNGETLDLIEKKSQSKVLKTASEAAQILGVDVYENYDAD